VLIQAHAELMQEEFQKLLDFDKDEDLQRMYALLARIPTGLEPLRKKFEEHVKKAGLAAVAKLMGEGAATEVVSSSPPDSSMQLTRLSSGTQSLRGRVARSSPQE